MDKNDSRKSGLKSRFGYTKKTEVKRDLQHISSKMRKMSLIHAGLLGVAFIYWCVMLYIGNQPIACTAVHEKISVTLDREKNVTDKRLMFHPSVDYEHAISTENMFECYMIRQGCAGWESKNLTINEAEVFCEANHTATTTEQEQCKSMCVPEPYMVLENVDHIGDIEYKPLAIEWYAIIHFWDLLWLIVAIYIQLRLRNLRDNQFGLSMVIDEKDIASTSLHILTVFISLTFYAIDLTMSTLWISLHNKDGHFEQDHGSYWTIYERNYLLKLLHAIYVTILLPILIVAFIIRDAFQRYEAIQFMTEIQ